MSFIDRLAFCVIASFACAVLVPQSAAACGGHGVQIFVEQQVRILPERAIQVQLLVLADEPKSSGAGNGEVRAKIVNVISGQGLGIVPGRQVVLSLEMEPTSCHWVGTPDSQKFVVAYVKIEERQGSPVLVLYPIPYSQRRNSDEEIETAAYFNAR